MPLVTILTALPVEYLAVRHHLNDLQEEIHPQGSIYERGTFMANGTCWQVGIAEMGAGNTSAAVEAERAIAHFNPDVLFLVGIAGGIKDVAIGDVVAATKVYGYESGKVEEEHFLTRPTLGQSAHALVQRARAEARKGEWFKRIPNVYGPRPRVFVAPIAAGEKVIASTQSEVYRFLRGSCNDAIAVEMEGYGVLSAAFAYPHIQAMVIRGISDLIDGKNDDSVEPESVRQERASAHASAFAFEMLAKLKIDSQKQRESQSESLSEPSKEMEMERPSNVSLSATERLVLVQTLNALPITQFDELVMALDPPPGILPHNLAAQGHRTPALLHWVEGPTGKGLGQLQAVLALVMNGANQPSSPPSNTDNESNKPSDARLGFYERQRSHLEADLKAVEADLATAQTTLAQEKLTQKAEQLLARIEELDSRLD